MIVVAYDVPQIGALHDFRTIYNLDAGEVLNVFSLRVGSHPETVPSGSINMGNGVSIPKYTTTTVADYATSVAAEPYAALSAAEKAEVARLAALTKDKSLVEKARRLNGRL